MSELLTRSSYSLKWLNVNVELPAALPVKSPCLLSQHERSLRYSLSVEELGGFFFFLSFFFPLDDKTAAVCALVTFS